MDIELLEADKLSLTMSTVDESTYAISDKATKTDKRKHETDKEKIEYIVG